MNEAPLAKLDIASVYGTEGQEFESLTVHQRGIIRIISSLQVIGSDLLFYFQNQNKVKIACAIPQALSYLVKYIFMKD